jgi:hypothetical protein
VTRKQREAAGDPRRSIEERYRDRDAYLRAVRRDAERLVKDGYVLPDDLELVIRNAADRYDYALKVGAAAGARRQQEKVADPAD